jgi:hypothetical protein
MKLTTLTVVAAAAILSLASCAYKDADVDPNLHGFFPDDAGETRHVNQIADAQAAAGARADAMLHKVHFDGPRLNSLGEQKLADMLRDDDAPAPMTVYLKLDEKAATSKAREASVLTYLKDLGLTENQVTILYGENPESRSNAAQFMGKMSKTETGSASTGGKDAAAGNDPSAPAAADDKGTGATATVK